MTGWCQGQGRTQTVAETQQPTGTGGEFSTFFSVQLNNSSQISFQSDLQNTSGGTTDNVGIYRWDNGLFSQIARKGQVAPDANGTFSSFDSLHLTDSGEAAFRGFLTNTSGGSTDDGGIVLGDGIDVLQVVRSGQSAIALAATTDTEIELGGLGLGEFDQMVVTGDLALDGDLLVSLIDGFRLTFNDEFLIADVGGELFGEFNGLSEGDLVGNLDGMDLFISYEAGSGNDVALFTAVPEPSTTVALGLLGIGLVLGLRRKRRNPSIQRCPKGSSLAAQQIPSRPIPRAIVLLAMGLVAGSSGVSSVSAQTTSWLGGAGNWFDVGNWDNGLPSQATDAQIDNGNAIDSDVLFNGTGPIGSLTIDAGDTLRIQHARVLSVENGSHLFTNNGLIQFEGTGFTRMLVDRSGVSAVDLSFAGNGTVRLADGNHSITAIGEPTLVNGVNHTIEGLGKVGNTNMRITNQGLLHGNVNGGTLTIDSGDSFLNTGTVRASNGGIVNMFSQNNTGIGLYEATGAGSTVHFFGASVSDATFNGTSGGLVFKNGSEIIDLENITNLGSFRAQSVGLIGTLNNQGRFTLVGGLNNNIELGTSDVHINGGGSIEFVQGGPNVTGGSKLFNHDNTFTGFGQFETEIQFAELSRIAPGTSSDATASFDFNQGVTIDGTMTLDLAGIDVNNAAPNINLVNTHTLASMGALNFDQLNIFDSALLGPDSLLDVNLTNGFIPRDGDFFDLLTADQLNLNSLADFNMPVINGLTFGHDVLTLFDPSTGFDRDVLRITFGATAVPEPSASWLIVIGLGLGVIVFRKRPRALGQQTCREGPAHRPRPRLSVLFLVSVCFQPFSLESVAQDAKWINTSNSKSFWDVGTNWTTGVAPGSQDVALFTQPNTYQVWWDAATSVKTPEVGAIQVQAGKVTFLNLTNGGIAHVINESLSVSGSGTTLTNSGLKLVASKDLVVSGNGSLFIDGNHVAGSSLTVAGTTSVSHGSLNFASNAQGQLNSGLAVNINNPNAAFVNILSGSSVTSKGVEIGTGTTQTSSSSGELNVAGTLRLTDRFALGNLDGLGSHKTNVTGGGDIFIENVGRSFVTRSGTLRVDGGTVTDQGRFFALTGALDLVNGGEIFTRDASVAGISGTTGGVATVSGFGSTWTDSGEITVGHTNRGSLTISAGGRVDSGSGEIGQNASSVGIVSVTGSGSIWSTGGLFVGSMGSGTLDITNRGKVETNNARIGFNPNLSQGDVTVSGSSSVLDVQANLTVGTTGTLNIQNNSLVAVTGSTTIDSGASVNLSGGRLEFGRTGLDSFGRINATGGVLAGNVEHTGFTDVGTLSVFTKPNVDVTEVSLSNRGTLFGGALLPVALTNETVGELRVLGGDLIRFSEAGNLNRGEINNFGGTVEFAQDVTNTSTGFIAGRGVFSAGGGWTNSGVMAFSAGISDVLGDVHNDTGGQIVTSGGATTTFYDDVVHDGVEIRTSAGSRTVFFGNVSGGSSSFPGPGFTGTGTVYMEGDLRPGNSPGVVGFEGDLVFGSTSGLFVELSGLLPGEFDQLLVAGDLSLDGGLQVDLINGFQLTFNDEFLIADVGQSLSGQFSGLSEGDLVGNFSGIDLFITYGAGSGNDVALFTAVPESPVGGLAGLLGLGCVLAWRRSKRAIQDRLQQDQT